MTKKYFLEALNLIVLVINIILYITALYTINIYSKNTTIIICSSIILIIIFLYKLYFSKKAILYNIGVFICFTINIILITTIVSLNTEYKYLNNIINKEYTYEKYNVYVSKKNPTYSNITKLSNKNIGLLIENQNNIKHFLDNEVNINYKVYNNIAEIDEAFKNNEIQSFIIKQNESSELQNQKEIRIISSYTIKNAIN